jgi:hypothetical protein
MAARLPPAMSKPKGTGRPCAERPWSGCYRPRRRLEGHRENRAACLLQTGSAFASLLIALVATAWNVEAHYRTHRKPVSMLRAAGARRARTEARTTFDALTHAPPRSTLASPLGRPAGLDRSKSR